MRVRGLHLLNVSIMASLTFVLAHQVQRIVVTDLYNLQTSHGLLEFQVISLIHGVRIGLAWMYGWLSVPLLIPALIYHAMYFNGTSLPSTTFVITSLLVALSAPLSLQIIRFATPVASASVAGAVGPHEWRVLLVAGTLSAMINAILLQYFYGVPGPSQVVVGSMLRWVASDTLGMVATAMVFLIAFRVLAWTRWRL